MKNLILKFYNERVEDLCTRLLYLMNTIDSFFVISGGAAFLLVCGAPAAADVAGTLIALALAVVCFKVADFHPWFTAFTPLYAMFFYTLGNRAPGIPGRLFLVNLGLYTLIQFLFMGIPDSIVARDASIPARKLWNSLWTVAATTVSFSMSVYFSFLLSLILARRPSPFDLQGATFWLVLFLCSLCARLLRRRTFVSKQYRPAKPMDDPVQRVVLLNIDGVRLDRFYAAGLPFLRGLEKDATYFPAGIETVYRALTNPAFASILTGTEPRVHGVRDNNIRSRIRTEALPDLVKTVLYGSMHVKHFSKPQWATRVVSLPVHSVYKSDDIMLEWLKDDIRARPDVRLFIADISETDFLGHAYGSESRRYLEALRRADARIRDFFSFLDAVGFLRNGVAVICSDHGIKNIDHSYLLFRAERDVPCMFTGKKIRKNNPLRFRASIMDIAPTLAYLMGAAYPERASGRVLSEAFA